MAYRTLGTDRIMEVASAPGTGNVALGGAVLGFRTFASVLASGDTCAYFIEGVDANGVCNGPWERGYGTFTTGPNTLARTITIASSAGGSTPANFTGNVRIGIGPTGETTANAYPAPGGRLTTNPSSPVFEGYTTGGVWYVPYAHDKIPLWNGGGIQVVTIPAAGINTNISGLAAGTAWDVFAYVNGFAPALTMLSWGATTTRGTPLTYQNGMLCESGAPGNRYLGSFYVSAAGQVFDNANTGTTGQPGKRMLWNMYNRVDRPIYMADTTASWSPANAWRIIRGAAAPNGCIEMFRGLDEDAVIAVGNLGYVCPNGAAGYCAIGLDGVNIPAPLGYGQLQNGNTGNYQANISVPYAGMPGLGYHYLALLDNGSTAAITGWNYGTAGLIGTVRC